MINQALTATQLRMSLKNVNQLGFVEIRVESAGGLSIYDHWLHHGQHRIFVGSKMWLSRFWHYLDE